MKLEFNLIDGLKTGGSENEEAKVRKQVVMEYPNAASFMDAEDKAEEIRFTPNGAQLVVSNTKLTRELMARSIVSIDDLKGASVNLLRNLTMQDYDLLLNKYMELENKHRLKLSEHLKRVDEMGKSRETTD